MPFDTFTAATNEVLASEWCSIIRGAGADLAIQISGVGEEETYTKALSAGGASHRESADLTASARALLTPTDLRPRPPSLAPPPMPAVREASQDEPAAPLVDDANSQPAASAGDA